MCTCGGNPADCRRDSRNGKVGKIPCHGEDRMRKSAKRKMGKFLSFFFARQRGSVAEPGKQPLSERLTVRENSK